MKLFRNILTGIFAAAFMVSSIMALGLALEYRAGNDRSDEALVLASGTEPTAPHTLPETAEPAPLPAGEVLPLATQTAEPESDQPAGAAPEPVAPTPTAPEPNGPAPIFDLHAPWLKDLDLEALREVNADVIGWILIPGTDISYPIVQGADNDYYLDHTWDGQPGATGAVFMEATHAADFSGFSTILYGHNLTVGNIFRQLHSYRDQSFWEENPYVYIATDAESFRYRIYAAYEAELNAATYWRDVRTELRQREYVQYGLDRSVLDTGVVPDNGAPILTLSTCTDYTFSRRWVVQAVLEGPITGDISQAFSPK